MNWLFASKFAGGIVFVCGGVWTLNEWIAHSRVFDAALSGTLLLIGIGLIAIEPGDKRRPPAAPRRPRLRAETPDIGWDPRTIESAKRRSEGTE